MSQYAKILSLSYISAEATKTAALKTYFRSVRLIKISGVLSPTSGLSSIYTNVLLCGNCIDYEERNLYVFYVDTDYNAAWIIEINIDSRAQSVVYYDIDNNIGFDSRHKIYNAKVVHGRLVWTDDLNPIYQMDIKRAKTSFFHGIGYGLYPNTTEWRNVDNYNINQIVSNGNNFYKSRDFNNTGHEPRMDSFVNNIGTYWIKLCLIEDAYYSMNIENFYFAPMPPKHPPVVKYYSDDSRKINNLRQTLFQVAYRYVYMDWRKSTFSPASIVPVPQSEEETATGLANEQPSLNNQLKITVNSGGEEVRAVEIVARSSDDPKTWYLIETKNKFEVEERGGEISETAQLPRVGIGITIPAPKVTSSSAEDVDRGAVGLNLPVSNTILSWIHPSVTVMGWLASEYGESQAKASVLDIGLGSGTLLSKPAWMTGKNSLLHNLVVGTTVIDDGAVTLYPASANTGAYRSGSVIFTDAMSNLGIISVYQEAVIILPIVNLSVIPSDSWTFTESTPANTYVNIGSTTLYIGFKAHDLSIPSNVVLNVQILKNGVHLMWDTTNGRNEFYTSDTFTLPVAAVAGDVYSVIMDEP